MGIFWNEEEEHDCEPGFQNKILNINQSPKFNDEQQSFLLNTNIVNAMFIFDINFCLILDHCYFFESGLWNRLELSLNPLHYALSIL